LNPVCLHNAVESALKCCELHFVDGIALVGAPFQMSVAIDQAGQHPVLLEVDESGAVGNRHLGGWRNSGDPLAFDHQHHVVAELIAGRF
jgi:hypothetical protein